MADELGVISGRLELNDGQFSGAISRGTTGLDSFGKQAMATAAGLVGAGSIVQALRTVTNVTKELTQSQLELDHEMAQVSTLVDTSQVNMQRLGDGVVSLAKKYGDTSGGLARALYQTISAGIDAKDSLMFLEEASRAAMAGATDTTTSVEAMVAAYNAFGYESGQLKEITDSLFVAIKRGVLTMDDLSPVIGKVAPMAAAVGATFDEMNGALATLTLTGMDAAVAGTSLRAMFANLVKPTKEAQEVAAALNIELGSKGIAAAGSFTEYMEELRVKTGGSEEALAKLFPNVRALTGALVLTGNGASKFADIMEEMEDKVGAADEAAAKMAQDLQVRWSRVGQWFSTTGMAIANTMILKPLTAVLDAFENVGYWMERLENETPGRRRMTDADASYGQATKWIEELTAKRKEYLRVLKEGSEAERELASININAINKRLVVLHDLVNTEDNRRKKKAEDAAAEEEEAKRQKERAAAAERDIKKAAEDEERRKELAKQRRREEKEAAREEERRTKRIYDLEKDTITDIHSLRKATLKERVEAYDKVAKSENISANQRLVAAIKASETRKEMARAEYEFKLSLLKTERDHALEMADENEEEVKAIEDRYKAASINIKNEWTTAVSKEVGLILKAKVETTEFNLAAERMVNVWYQATEDGEYAIGDLVESMSDGIGVLTDDWEELGQQGAEAIEGIGNLLTSLMSGEGIGSYFDWIFDTLWSYVDDAFGENSSLDDAVKRQKELAEEAGDAARRFARLLGEEEFVGKTPDELVGLQGETVQGMQDALRSTGLSGAGQLQVADLVNIMGASQEEISAAVAAGSSSSAAQALGDRGYNIWQSLRMALGGSNVANEGMDFWKLVTGQGTGGDSTFGNSMAVGSAAWTIADLGGQFGEINTVLTQTLSGALDPDVARTFAGARAALEAQQEQGQHSREWLDVELMKYVKKFRNEMTAEDYATYYNRAIAAGWDPETRYEWDYPISSVEAAFNAAESDRDKWRDVRLALDAYMRENNMHPSWKAKWMNWYAGRIGNLDYLDFANTEGLTWGMTEGEIAAIQAAGASNDAGGYPQLAQGGIISSPTMAMVGEGGVPEAVIPLDKINEVMASLSIGSGQLDLNINVSGETGSAEVVGAAAGEALVDYFRSKGV